MAEILQTEYAGCLLLKLKRLPLQEESKNGLGKLDCTRCDKEDWWTRRLAGASSSFDRQETSWRDTWHLELSQISLWV